MMKTSVKALLLSAVVYPGAGHIVLKAKKMGIVLITLFSIPLLFVIEAILSTTTQVSKQIAAGQMSINIQAISDATHAQLQQSAGGQFSLLCYILVGIWTVALIDVYRLNKTVHHKNITKPQE